METQGKKQNKTLDIVICAVVSGVVSFGYLGAIVYLLANGKEMPNAPIGIVVILFIYQFVKSLIKLVKNKY